jgi:urocanate hydratase
MGGAQPLAVTMNDGVAICVDCDPRAIERRIEHRYLDVKADSLEHALQLAVEARDARRPLSIGLLGNAADLLPRMLAEGAPIDIVTDQTSAHDPLSYLPVGVDFDDMASYAAKDPAGFTTRARESMATHVEAMVGFMDAGAEVFDYGNSIRGEAQLAGYDRAFAFPGFVPAYIRPLFCEGKGPFRWAALSGEASDIAKTDKAITSRACRRASAGSVTASATGRASGSTTWWRAASWPPRWRSAGTTSTAVPSPPRTARPRRCSTVPTPSRTGRC